jgi:selenocysteine-specific elongation factor
MRVIGTAGHVDHGKSTLVQAMTGTHPDRLKEEQEREMTIDLGFAWLTLPGGEDVGIVDVPGHRDFIENMLAGIGGIDAALFVVAADEGVMPQTREHLAILDILQIQGGVVALTKIDLIDEGDLSRSEWLDLVEAEVQEVLSGTVLEDAPIVRVSARTGEGVPKLIEALAENLASRPPRPDYNRPRLPIDRAFTISGFGTVVTGTLTDGYLRVGDEIEILPGNLHGRVRGLQTHKRKEEVAVPGARTAVNISGVDLDEIQRGDVVAHPGDYRPTRRMDVQFRLLPDASMPVRHNIETKLFIGAAEVIARVRLLGADELRPGETGWLQLELQDPVVALRGDRYILRRPSPGETLGGGMVVDPHPKGRHKRFSQETLQRLQALAQGSPAEVLYQAALAMGAAPLRQVILRSNLAASTAGEALSELVETEQIVFLDSKTPEAAGDHMLQSEALIATQSFWNRLADQIIQSVKDYHKTAPLRLGMPREELKSRLKNLTKGSARLFNAALERLIAAGDLQQSGPLVLIPGHSVQFSPPQEAKIETLMARFKASPYAPPTIKESQAEVGEELFNALLDLEQLIAVSPEVVFRKQDYQEMLAEVRQLLQERGEVTAAEVRDHFNTSRRYALAFLEHLDASGVTIRKGDVRRLRSR